MSSFLPWLVSAGSASGLCRSNEGPEIVEPDPADFESADFSLEKTTVGSVLMPATISRFPAWKAVRRYVAARRPIGTPLVP
jgi:hypothetical protein